MTKEALIQIVDQLRQLRGRSAPNAPKGLPRQPQNGDNTIEGKYWDENLTDPGILHGVTGTGNGPLIAGGR